MGEYYIGQYRDHYAIFDSMGRVQTQYDTHAEAKADLDSYNKTGKPLPESTVMNEGLFGLGKKKEIPKVTVDEIKIIPTNFRKAYDNWWFYLPLKNNMDKDMLCDISNRIRKICNSEYGFDAYPTEFMVCSPKDIVREYKVDDYFDKEYLKNKNNIVICDYEFVGKSNIKSVASLKQRLGARYFNDVVNNAVYYQIKDDPKNKGIPIPELINNSKNYAVSYIDKDTLMAMYNYFASRTSANESVSFYEHTLNEGIFTAINIGFWGFVGICCIISGILDKKHGKEVKTNLTDAEFKAIKNDTIAVAKSLIAAQKSSPFYNNIYKYNRITQDSYKDMIDNFNKGNLYSCTVRFFDAENFENYKSYYKEYGEWGNSNPNWEKLEKSVNTDMVKIIESLGFDIKTGKSSKYPNCEVRVADGEVVYVYPKAPDDILERGKKYKKKMNEDHSEISNDPEMEKLLALAGCTIEDLDTINNEEDIELDDDDPIDANTSREIDAVMDESIGDFVRDTKNYFKNASEFLKHRKENSKSKRKDSEADIKNTPAYKEANKKLEIFGDSIGKKVAAHLKDYATKNNFKSVYKNTAFDINDIKYCPINGYDVQVSDLQDGIDYDRIPAWEEQNPGKDWQKEPQFNNDWYHELLTEGRDYAESLLEKDCPDIYTYDIGTGDGDEGLVYIDIFFTSSYINTIKEESKNSQNESAVGIGIGIGAIAVAGIGSAIVSATEEKRRKANAIEMTKSEFNKMIDDMVSINDAIVSKLKTSKWWKYIYEPCMNSSKNSDVHGQATKFKQEFASAKYVGPSFHPDFIDIDNSDPKIYTKLSAEANKSNTSDDYYYEAFNEAYYESKVLIKTAIKKFGFDGNGSSTKYPNIKVVVNIGEIVGVDITTTYNGYFMCNDFDKKSQNESAAADDYHKNHEERMKNLNKKIDELNNDRKKDNEVREKQDKNAAALRDLLGESTPDLDFIMESIFMDIDH